MLEFPANIYNFLSCIFFPFPSFIFLKLLPSNFSKKRLLGTFIKITLHPGFAIFKNLISVDGDLEGSISGERKQSFEYFQKNIQRHTATH